MNKHFRESLLDMDDSARAQAIEWLYTEARIRKVYKSLRVLGVLLLLAWCTIAACEIETKTQVQKTKQLQALHCTCEAEARSPQ